MKHSLLIYLSITLFFFSACNRKRGPTSAQDEADTTAAMKPDCYIATFEKDTAYLTVKGEDKKKVEGNLLIKYRNNPENNGTFVGQFSGDTLFADYTYTVGSYKDRIVKNPLAFLAKGDSLILGVGEIETMVGRSYFKPGTPINFDIGRFRFNKTECSTTHDALTKK